MALSLKFNGRAAQNLITASWFNDFYNLFTGNMSDQPITFKPAVTHQNISLSGMLTAPAAAVAAGTNLGVGTYKYAVTFITADGGESLSSSTTSITTTSGNQAVNLSSIPVGPSGTAKRGVYRTKVGGSQLYLLTTLADNITTTYADTTADTSLIVPLHTRSTFGGMSAYEDASSNVNLRILGDGSILGNVLIQAFNYTPATSLTLALAAGTSLGVGAYQYQVTFASINGESLPGPAGSITTTTSNQNVNLSNIPTGPTGTTKRNIYRTKVGGSTFYLLHTLSDNTTTTYADTTADTSLPSTNPPSHATFGGSLILVDASGTVQLTIASDGNISGNLSSSVPYGWNKTLGGSNQAILDMTPPDGPKRLQLLYTGDGTGNMAWRNVTDGVTQMFWTPTGDLNINGSLILNNFTMSQPSGGYGYFNNFNASPYGFRFNSNGTVIAHLDNNATNTSVLLHSQQLGGSPDYAEIVRVDDDTLAPGTVICPSGTEDSYGDHWASCTHDDCPAALIISTNPSVTAGGRLIQTETNGVLDFVVDTDPHWKPLAVSGRVPVTIQGAKTGYSYRMAVVSAGNGQIRPATTGDTNILGYVSALSVDGMGAALSSTQVLVMLR